MINAQVYVGLTQYSKKYQPGVPDARGNMHSLELFQWRGWIGLLMGWK